MSPQTQSQYFALHTSPASSAKIHNKNTSVEELTGGSIKKNKVEEAIYFLNQEEKTPKSSESISCKDVSSKQDNSSSGQKSASFALDTKWYNDDSDLSNFIMLRSKCTLIQREEKNYVGSPEKGMWTSLFCRFSRFNSALLYQLQQMLVHASVFMGRKILWSQW